MYSRLATLVPLSREPSPTNPSNQLAVLPPRLGCTASQPASLWQCRHRDSENDRRDAENGRKCCRSSGGFLHSSVDDKHLRVRENDRAHHQPGARGVPIWARWQKPARAPQPIVGVMREDLPGPAAPLATPRMHAVAVTFCDRRPLTYRCRAARHVSSKSPAAAAVSICGGRPLPGQHRATSWSETRDEVNLSRPSVRWSSAAELAIAVLIVPALPVAQTSVSVVVMSGLDSPRGLAFGPEGALYVTEAGRDAGVVTSSSHVVMRT